MENESILKALVLDESVILFTMEDDTVQLQPGVDSLLRVLRYSNISTGFCCQALSPRKISFLENTAASYSMSCFSSFDEISVAYPGNSVVYVVSHHKLNALPQLMSYGWWLVALGDPNQDQGNEVSSQIEHRNLSLFHIKMLLELPLMLCRLYKKVNMAGEQNILMVGYIMKPSRREDFAKVRSEFENEVHQRGAFPMRPSRNGLCFVPLTFELPLSSQLQEVDIVLHKATDEIISIDLSNSLNVSSRIIYSEGMEELRRYGDHHPEQCIIDPFDNISPVLDRLKIQHILCGIEDLNKEGCPKIRGPHFLKVESFNEEGLERKLTEAELTLPCIVKPQVACGVADAHSMAIVFTVEDFKDLQVPLPAIVQEYVDHSSTMYKFYVLGGKVFHAVKKSIPDAHVLMKLCESSGLKPLLFDSLRSLPTATGNHQPYDGSGSDCVSLSLELDLVHDAAAWLMRKLDLTIFGFDVVVQEGIGDYVIVDVNYLPSFKEVPDDIAVPTFWDAIKKKFISKKMK